MAEHLEGHKAKRKLKKIFVVRGNNARVVVHWITALFSFWP